MKKLKRFENDICSKPYEIMGIFDYKGEIISTHTQYSPDYVSFEIHHNLLHNSIITHNHVSEHSDYFSSLDIVVFLTAPIREIRMITPKKTIFSLKRLGKIKTFLIKNEELHSFSKRTLHSILMLDKTFKYTVENY